MTPTLEVGTILIEDPLIARHLELDSESCSGNWNVVKVHDGSSMDQAILAAGWNLFFMAGEVESTFWGRSGTKKIQKAVQRILEKVKNRHFNALEITGIVSKRFLGVRYATVSAHSRHFQQSCRLDAIGRDGVRSTTQ